MSDTSHPGRREFLLRMLKAAGVAAVAGITGYRCRDSSGPRPPTAPLPVKLPDFSVAGDGPRLSIASGPDRAVTVRRALDALGGMKRFIAPGDRVLLKVNAAFATPPLLGATTHPALLSEVIRLCVAAGAASVVVTDHPINDPASCFELSGLGPAARRAGARVVVPTEADFRPVTLAGGRLIRDWPVLWTPLSGVTKLIGLAPVKDHHRAGASMAMKNWYGLLGGRRSIFHQDIHSIIAELAVLVKPTLVILDGTASMMTNGPTGGSVSDLKTTETMIAGTDQVAVDAVGATLLGRRPSDIPYITRAAAAGAGTANYEMLDPVRT